MKKIAIIFIILLVALLSFGHWAFHYPSVSMMLAHRAIERSLPGASVQELSIASQKFVWPGHLSWQDIKLQALYKGKAARVSIRQAELSGLESLLHDRSVIKLSAAGGEISFDLATLQSAKVDLKLHFERREFVMLEGPVAVSSIVWDRLKAGQMTFSLRKDTSAVMFRDIVMQAYGGTVSGSVRLIPEELVYAADLNVAGLDTSALSDWNDQIAQQLSGRLSGSIRLTGRGPELVSLEGDASMSDGAKVNAALLSMLAQYIPASQEKKRLDDLIKTGARLPVEVLSLKIKSQTPRHLAGEISLKSREVNLELNLTNDIHTDGTLTSLTEYWRRY